MPHYGCVVVIKRNGVDGSVFPMTERECFVGKHADCDIRVQVEAAADKHAKLHVDQDQQVWLTVLCNEHALSLNNVEVAASKPLLLRDGDVFSIGQRAFRWNNLPIKNVASVQKSPKQVQKSPKQVQKTPKQAEKSPNEEVKTPKQAEKSPKEEVKTPKQAKKSPKQAEKSPKQAEKSPKEQTPKQVSKSPKPLLETDELVESGPKQVEKKSRQGIKTKVALKMRKSLPATTLSSRSPVPKLSVKKRRSLNASKAPPQPQKADHPKEGKKKPAKKSVESLQKDFEKLIDSSLKESEKPSGSGLSSKGKKRKSLPLAQSAGSKKGKLRAKSMGGINSPSKHIELKEKDQSAKKEAKKASPKKKNVTKSSPNEKVAMKPSPKKRDVTPKQSKTTAPSRTPSRRVSFGPYVSPEYIDKCLPPNSPVRRGAPVQKVTTTTPKVSQRSASPATSLLKRTLKKMTAVPSTLVEEHEGNNERTELAIKTDNETPGPKGQSSPNTPTSTKRSSVSGKTPLKSDKKVEAKKPEIDSKQRRISKTPLRKVVKRTAATPATSGRVQKPQSVRKSAKKMIQRKPLWSEIVKNPSVKTLKTSSQLTTSKKTTGTKMVKRAVKVKKVSTTSNQAPLNMRRSGTGHALSPEKLVIKKSSTTVKAGPKRISSTIKVAVAKKRVSTSYKQTPSKRTKSIEKSSSTNKSNRLRVTKNKGLVDTDLETDQILNFTESDSNSSLMDFNPKTPRIPLEMFVSPVNNEGRTPRAAALTAKVLFQESLSKRSKEKPEDATPITNSSTTPHFKERKSSIEKKQKRSNQQSNVEKENVTNDQDVSFSHIFEDSKVEKISQGTSKSKSDKTFCKNNELQNVSFSHIFASGKKSPTKRRASGANSTEGNADVSFAHLFDDKSPTKPNSASPKKKIIYQKSPTKGQESSEVKDVSFAHIFVNESTKKSPKKSRTSTGIIDVPITPIFQQKNDSTTKTSSKKKNQQGRKSKEKQETVEENDVSFAQIFDTPSTQKGHKKRSLTSSKSQGTDPHVSFAHIFEEQGQSVPKKARYSKAKTEPEKSSDPLDVSFGHIFESPKMSTPKTFNTSGAAASKTSENSAQSKSSAKQKKSHRKKGTEDLPENCNDISIGHLFNSSLPETSKVANDKKDEHEFEISDVSFAHIFDVAPEKNVSSRKTTKTMEVPAVSPRRTRRARDRVSKESTKIENETEQGSKPRRANLKQKEENIEASSEVGRRTRNVARTRVPKPEEEEPKKPTTRTKKAVKNAVVEKSKETTKPRTRSRAATKDETNVKKVEAAKAPTKTKAGAATKAVSKTKTDKKETVKRTAKTVLKESKIENVEEYTVSPVATRRSKRNQEIVEVKATVAPPKKSKATTSKKESKEPEHENSETNTGRPLRGSRVKSTQRSVSAKATQQRDEDKENKEKNNGTAKTCKAIPKATKSKDKEEEDQITTRRGRKQTTTKESTDAVASKANKVDTVSPLKTRRGTAVRGPKITEKREEEIGEVKTTRSGRVLRSRK